MVAIFNKLGLLDLDLLQALLNLGKPSLAAIRFGDGGNQREPFMIRAIPSLGARLQRSDKIAIDQNKPGSFLDSDSRMVFLAILDERLLGKNKPFGIQFLYLEVTSLDRTRKASATKKAQTKEHHDFHD